MRFWTSELSGLEINFLAPTRGGRPWFLGRGLYRLVDTCFIDGYMGIGAAIPLGTDLNWQRANLSLGLEWNLPEIEELVFILEVGIFLTHYRHWGDWY